MATQPNINEVFIGSILPQPPEQLHPAQINFAKFGDHPVLKQASDALGMAWEGIGSIDKLRANPHPEDRPATHARKVRQAVTEFGNAWAQRADGAKAALKAEHRRVEAELETAANLKANERHFGAIVGTFQGLNPGAKAQALDQLIEQGDGPTLATLIDAPLFVTGLTAEQRDAIKMRLLTKVNPAGVALRDQLAKALAKMEAASMASIDAQMKLNTGTDRFDRKSREVEELATRARSGFSA
ncbi:MAG TPA: hypothetical protein VGB79_10055 [Allosphingosinicella sp.]|jgi:hypothetical protein